MSAPIVIPPGGGEIVGDAPERRVEILAEHDALHATWSRFGPRRDGAELHVHREHTDLFYVLDGELTIRLGPAGDPVAVTPGTLVRVPPLVVHGFRNSSDADVRYLNLHAPGQGFADFLRALRDGEPAAYDQHPPPTHGGRSPSDAAIGAAVAVVDRPGPGVDLLADIEEIEAIEVRAEAGRPPPPPRTEPDRVVSFYVLEGDLALTAGGGDLRAAAGSWIEVPRGVPHAAFSLGPSRYLELHTPGGGSAI